MNMFAFIALDRSVSVNHVIGVFIAQTLPYMPEFGSKLFLK